MSNFYLVFRLFVLTVVAGITTAIAQEDSTKNATPPTSGHLLRQILLAENSDAALKLNAVPGDQFLVATGRLSFLETDDLKKSLIIAKDHPIDGHLLGVICQLLTNYLHQHSFPIVDVSVPAPQSIVDGAVRFVVTLGKFRQIRFVGNRWFSEAQLLGSLHVARGEIVKFMELDNTIGWVNNNNPFRRLQAKVEQVENSDEADLVIGVQERIPLRLSSSFDNSGNAILGNEHYSAGLTYGNLWKADHQISYQFITTNRSRYFQGHVISYRAPLPWRHYLEFDGTYLRAKPEILDGLFNQDAENISASLRYTIPLRGGDNPVEYFVSSTFKESNNNLEFGGTSVQSSKTDVFQLSTGVSIVKRDARGAWVFGANATWSPGDVNSRNTALAFSTARAGARPDYAYGSLSFQRLLSLDRGWELSSRGFLQASTRNLLSSEQLSIGGSSTVRGFRESVFTGDAGFVFSNDLQTPVVKWHPVILPSKYVPIDVRFLGFYDAAKVRNRQTVAFDVTSHPVAGSGVGVRMNWANIFSLSADYGWQITHLPYAHDDHGRGHIKVSLAY